MMDIFLLALVGVIAILACVLSWSTAEKVRDLEARVERMAQFRADWTEE